MLQSWLRCGSRKYGYWDVGATNFKQCCGHTTDLVVDMIHDFKGKEKHFFSYIVFYLKKIATLKENEYETQTLITGLDKQKNFSEKLSISSYP